MDRLIVIASIVGLIGTLLSVVVMCFTVGEVEGAIPAAIVMVVLWTIAMIAGVYIDVEKAIPDVAITEILR